MGARCRIALERRKSLLRFPFIEQKLRQLLDAALIRGLARQQIAQDGFRFVLVVLQAVQPGEPQSRIAVGGIEPHDFAVLLGGARDRVTLARGVAHIAECSHVNASEQAVRAQIVGVLGQNRLRLGHRVANSVATGNKFPPAHRRFAGCWDRA